MSSRIKIKDAYNDTGELRAYNDSLMLIVDEQDSPGLALDLDMEELKRIASFLKENFPQLF